MAVAKKPAVKKGAKKGVVRKAAKKGSGDAAGGGRVRVTLVRGWAGKTDRQVRTLRSLGLRRSGDANELSDVASVQGAISKVAHLVRVEPAT